MSGLSQVDPSARVGSILPAAVDGVEAAVIHHAEGWAMVADMCPHAKCAFTENGEVVDGVTLICNCHGSEFDLRSGETLLGPAQEPLRIVCLRVESGQLKVADR